MNKRIVHLEKAVSTNLYIRELQKLSELEEGFVVWADYQTSGRGQQGNTWESECGKNLLFSLVLRPHFIDAGQQFLVSQIVSLAIRNVLDKYTSGITIKWPNDIYWHNKKICGILIENDLMQSQITQSIVGIGININQETFRSDAPNPVSLLQITQIEHNREVILEQIADEIFSLYQSSKTDKESIVGEYKNHLYRNNAYFLYKDKLEVFEAKIEDIEPSGILVLKTKDDRLKRFAFKEVIYL